MFTRKLMSVLALSFVMVAVGCVPKKNSKTNLRGRGALGTRSTLANGQPTKHAPAGNTTYGEISGYDQNFYYSVFLLAQPSLDGASADEQLGSVQGVRFWGDNIGNQNQGNLNSNSARLHVEIYDEKADPVVIHIGPDQEGYQGMQGSAYGGSATLTFSSDANVISLQGQVSGNEFSGTVMFINAYTPSGQYTTLGTFRVPACGFFRCQ